MKFFRFVAFAVVAIVFTGMPLAAGAGPTTGPEAPGSVLGAAFTYQGQLIQNGTPVNGTCDFRFTLFDAVAGGGGFNAAGGFEATVPGGGGNTASGDYTFAAGQELYRLAQEQASQIASLQARNADLEARLAALEAKASGGAAPAAGRWGWLGLAGGVLAVGVMLTRRGGGR